MTVVMVMVVTCDCSFRARTAKTTMTLMDIMQHNAVASSLSPLKVEFELLPYPRPQLQKIHVLSPLDFEPEEFVVVLVQCPPDELPSLAATIAGALAAITTSSSNSSSEQLTAGHALPLRGRTAGRRRSWVRMHQYHLGWMTG